MLDLVSNGRVEFGTGESSSRGRARRASASTRSIKREQWLEGLEVAVRCMTETPFTGVDGKYVTMPPRNVVPKPVQKPHPPLWVACSPPRHDPARRREGHRRADVRVHRPRRGASLGRRLRATLAEKCVPVGEAVNPQVACVTPMMCTTTRTRRSRRGARGRQLLRLLARPLLRVRRAPARRDRRVGRVPASGAAEQGYDPEAAAAALEAGAARRQGRRGRHDGSARRDRHARPDPRVPRRYEEAGVDQVIFVLQAGKNRHEHIMESLELFGREVLPEFAERDEKQVARRRRSASSRSSRRCMARKERRRRATSTTTRSRRSRGSGPTPRARKR